MEAIVQTVQRMSSPGRLSLFARLSGCPKSEVSPAPEENNGTSSAAFVDFKDEEQMWDTKSQGSISSEDCSELAVFSCARQRPKSQQQLWERDEMISALSTLPAGKVAISLIPSLYGEELCKILHKTKTLDVTDSNCRSHRLSTPSFDNGYIRKASLAAENEAAAAAEPEELIAKWPNTCLLVSCFFGNFDLAKHLLSKGARVDSCDGDGRTPLHLAASSGSVEIIEELLKHGAKPGEWDASKRCTPLHCAAAAGNVRSVKQLIKAGADVNAGLEVKSPLHYAVLNNAGDCVEALLEAGASANNPQVYTETPLHVAASLGSARCVSLLLNHRAEVRVQFGNTRSTPLHLAAEEGSVECTKLLLEHKAQWDAKNSRGQTALHLAALAQSAETMDLLIKAANDVNVLDDNGRTPLHAAVAKAMRGGELVKALIQAGADVNKPDKYGYTPLHIAALNENSSLVLLLLANDADLTARTIGGISALSFIVRRTPDVLPKFLGHLDQAISLHDHELGDVDCELRLDFKPLISGGRGEADLLLCLIDVGQRHALQHPLCESFLYLKWLRIRKFFLISLFFHSIFAGVFTAYILIQFFFHKENLGNLLRWPVLGFTCALACKEIFQIAHGITGYAKRWENWLQWSVIISAGSVLISSGGIWSHHVAALGITLAWIELMVVVGRFPMFGLYIQMFTQVSINFFKFLGAYSCLIIGFSLGFTVIHQDYKSFKNPFVGLIKTIVMMSGELEFEDMFWQDSNSIINYPGTMHVMFLVFVILVTVILTNLLVGLAVSDIQELQRCAGLERLIRRAELVAHLESLLFSRLLDYAPIKIVKMCRKGALLLHPPYHCAIHIRPNDPRDNRLPKDLVKAVYNLVIKRKQRGKVTRCASTRSINSMEVGDIRLSRLHSIPSTSEYNRQQIMELAAELKKCSGKLGAQLDTLTSKVQLIIKEMEHST
ncbi:transient receptor potential channel pyrexia [Athalia rosae]|uniref:transient receptor potential channel pyrexia n=1 Tax=Athalia rosae TaxID=37344 RepID=UPI00203403BF|nr:transient receptor potential channel pyrexia [Athalia rosae]XP_048507942.1 transient receptor potential channel pyrexia [Athalia rosae]